MSSKPDETDSDHVSIDHISPHPSPGASQGFFEQDITARQIEEVEAELKMQNPYDNIQNVLSASSPQYSKPNKSFDTTSSTTSDSTFPSSHAGGEFSVLCLVISLSRHPIGT